MINLWDHNPIVDNHQTWILPNTTQNAKWVICSACEGEGIRGCCNCVAEECKQECVSCGGSGKVRNPLSLIRNNGIQSRYDYTINTGGVVRSTAMREYR